MAIGIKELAQHLGLSIGTVSRALNDRPDVSPDSRKRVREAAEALGYVPNQSGRSLRSGATGVVAFMMQTGHETTGQGDTFFMSVFDGVQSVLARHRLDLVALLCPSDENADDYLKRMVSRRIADAFILSSTQTVDPRITFLSKQGMPFVTLGRSQTDGGQPWVDLDFAAMAQQAVDRLVAAGHRRIAMTVPQDGANLGRVFADAAQAALTAHGLPFDHDLMIAALPSERGGYEAAQRLATLPDRPTAVVLIDPSHTTGLYRGLTESGLAPGHDIAVVGRWGPQAAYLSPSLTHFREDLFACGVTLCEALLASMPTYAEKYPGGLVRALCPTVLVPGDSA